MKKGIRIISQDMDGYPSLHIRLRIQVQNNIYINLSISTSNTLGTIVLTLPMCNVVGLPVMF